MTTKKRTTRKTQKPQVRKKCAIKFTDESLTKQSFAPECDINKIVDKFTKTGQLPINTRPPTYGSAPPHSIKEIQDAIASSKSMYEQLPQNVKEKFTDANDFITALSDDDRAHEIANLGIESKNDTSDTPTEENPPESPPVQPTATPDAET